MAIYEHSKEKFEGAWAERAEKEQEGNIIMTNHDHHDDLRSNNYLLRKFNLQVKLIF